MQRALRISQKEVTCLLTVLIYQKSSQTFIDRYRNLFETYEESGQIAFCFWDEHGTDVASALPELTAIVRGVREWQAVVVMPHLEDFEEEQALHRQENPFDFLCNAADEPVVEESEIPLIRLAQMLGGVPLVARHYVNRMNTQPEGGKALSVVREESDEELERQQKIWNDLTDQYSFSCERPGHIYLFKARYLPEIKLPTEKDTDVIGRYESDSSMFWYRNRYPARTRFLIQDCSRPGNVHYEADLFRFWITALVLSLNHFSSGTFEAYKVYQTCAKIDLDDVQILFSRYYNRMNATQFRANLQIRELQKNSRLEREQEELPHYACDVPVHFEMQENPDLSIPTRQIGLTGDCPMDEIPWWHGKVNDSMKAVRKLHGSARMVLDRASLQCRYASKLTEEEICELDEYQMADMEQELSELEQKILTFDTCTALPMRRYRRELRQAEERTAEEMKKRMTRGKAILAGIAVLVIYLIGFLPDLLMQVQTKGSVLGTLGIILTGCGVLVAVSIGSLFYFRSRVCQKMNGYNEIIYRIIHNFQQLGTVFSCYLSDCSSYMRGKFLLQALQQKTIRSSEEIVQLGRHVEYMNHQMDLVSGWLNDLDMKVLEDSGEHQNDYFDFEIPPENNRGYSIQMDCETGYIPTDGGEECMTPYPFVHAFTVKREPLFEKRTK